MKFRDQMKGVTPILQCSSSSRYSKRGDGPHSNNPHVRKSVLERQEKQRSLASERDNGQRGLALQGLTITNHGITTISEPVYSMQLFGLLNWRFPRMG